jgi:hypothetical protein
VTPCTAVLLRGLSAAKPIKSTKIIPCISRAISIAGIKSVLGGLPATFPAARPVMAQESGGVAGSSLAGDARRGRALPAWLCGLLGRTTTALRYVRRVSEREYVCGCGHFGTRRELCGSCLGGLLCDHGRSTEVSEQFKGTINIDIRDLVPDRRPFEPPKTPRRRAQRRLHRPQMRGPGNAGMEIEDGCRP